MQSELEAGFGAGAEAGKTPENIQEFSTQFWDMISSLESSAAAKGYNIVVGDQSSVGGVNYNQVGEVSATERGAVLNEATAYTIDFVHKTADGEKEDGPMFTAKDAVNGSFADLPQLKSQLADQINGLMEF
ncbi:hypothetical protein KBC79_06575 [Candidatus Woesebacteria bacterium]|nr:hypothetical protein [Candidatus Woesebacteria bacterium]